MNSHLIRIFDILISSIFLVILLPFFIFISLIILVFSGTPIFLSKEELVKMEMNSIS